MQNFKYAALAQDLFSFRKLNDPAANFTSFGDSAINDRGIVAFSAAKASSSQLSGIYTSDGKKTTTVIEQSGLTNLFNDVVLPAIYGGGQYSFGNDVEINTKGNVLFEAKASFLQVGGSSNSLAIDRLFLKKGNEIVKVAEIQSSNQAGRETVAYTGLSLNDRDQVVYATDITVDSPYPPYEFENTTIFFNGRILANGYRGNGTETRVYDPIITNDGSIYYAASGTSFTNNYFYDYRNIYRLAPGAKTGIELSQQPIDVTDLSVNNRGDVVFSGSLASGESGLFQLNSAGIKKIGNPSANLFVNDFNIVAYQPLQNSTPTGISVTVPWINNFTQSIVAPGDVLFGSTVNSVALDGFNRSGQIAFTATFADGTSGVFRADPTLNQRSLIDAGINLALTAIV